MGKLVSVLIVVAVFTAGAMFALIGHAQSDKRRRELFTSYVSGLAFQVDIPAAACHAIIAQADRIVASDELKSLTKHDLQVASLNLRSCATSKDLARIDRDLAVGAYGEVVSEQERRERGEK